MSTSHDPISNQENISVEEANQVEKTEVVEPPLSEVEKRIIEVVMFFNVSIEEASAR